MNPTHKQFILQARPRSMANVKRADGTEYDHKLISAQYRDTDLTAVKSCDGRQLLEDARNNKLTAYPAKAFKFRIRRVDLDAPVPVEAESVGAS